MTVYALLHKPPSKPLCFSGHRVAYLHRMGALSEDHVDIRCSSKAGDPHIITINCTYRFGLARDVARTIFESYLDVVQADFSTDGPWCLLLFWVTPRYGSAQSVKWDLLKEHLILECPSPSPSLSSQFSSKTCTTEKKIYLLQTCSTDRLGLLNDIAHTLWKLELEVLKVKALTSLNGSAVSVFLLRDIRSKIQDRGREVVCERVESVLGDSRSFCELSLASVDDVNETFDLQMVHGVPGELLTEDLLALEAGADTASNASKLCLNIDNSFSPAHTLLQITSCERRGLLYDCLRALRDLNLQIAYGRFKTPQAGSGAFDLIVSQPNGAKLLDPDKQKSLQTRLRLDMCEPIRVIMVDNGLNTELLVAKTVETCGTARPRILLDVTLALKMLEIGIFKADSEKICHGETIWELYRFLLVEQASSSFMSHRMKNYVAERVTSVLMG